MFTKSQLSGIDRSIRNGRFRPFCTLSVDSRDIVAFFPESPDSGVSNVVCLAWVDYVTDGNIVRDVPEVVFALFFPDRGDGAELTLMVDTVRIHGGLPRDQAFDDEMGAMPINLPYVGDVLEHTDHPYFS